MKRKPTIQKNAKVITYGYAPGSRDTSVTLEFEDCTRLEVHLDADGTTRLSRHLKEVLEFAWRDGRQPIDHQPGESIPLWLYSNHLQCAAERAALCEKKKTEKEANVFGLTEEQWLVVDQADDLLHLFKNCRNATSMEKWKAEFERLTSMLASANVPTQHPTHDEIVMMYVQEIFPLFLSNAVNV